MLVHDISREDDPTLQLLMKKALSFLGHKCVVVGTGEAALEQMSSEISLIFMDIGLPGLDGIQTAELIRAGEAKTSSRIPIIALTAQALKADCMQGGMDDFLLKPAMIADYKRVLDTWMIDDFKRAD